MLTIEGCGSPSFVQNAIEKIAKNNLKFKRIGQAISWVLDLGPKHDNIRVQWIQYSYKNGIIIMRPMMCVSFTMAGNIHEGNWFVIDYWTLKCVRFQGLMGSQWHRFCSFNGYKI